MVFLYGITLKKSTNINKAIIGSFTRPKQQEILVSKGKIIELYVQDPDTGITRQIFQQEVFGCIRSMAAFRMTTKERDFVVIGSDSGRVVILRYSEDSNNFEKIHQETYGKSGCRRAVPGEYLIVEPKGRALMISAIEKQKFVYVLNRDNQNRLTISSPLPAHKPSTITFFLTQLDVGYENPSFASLEIDYTTFDSNPRTKYPPENLMLTFYELDLGVNHVVKRWQSLVPPNSHYLVTVPGGSFGPGGVLVCFGEKVIYKNEGFEDVVGQFPRRRGYQSERELLIIGSTHYQKRKKFFFLVQNELGDLFKITLDGNEEEVKGITVEYFDTVAISSSISIMKTGYLFVSAEFGDHELYHFDRISGGQENNTGPDYYSPSLPKHLSLVQTLASLSPILDFEVQDLHNEGTPQMFCLCGRGTDSSFRILRQGQRVEGKIDCLLEDAKPRDIWSVPAFPTNTTTDDDVDDEQGKIDGYILISILYEDIPQTMVFQVEPNSLVELKESRFSHSVQTIHISTFPSTKSTELMIGQVHANGIRLVKKDSIQNWEVPVIAEEERKQSIRCAASNDRQLAVGLAGGLVVYFEISTETNRLEELDRKQFDQEISCISLDPVPIGNVRGRFVCIGTYDRVMRLYAVGNGPGEFMEKVLTRQMFPSEPVSLCFMDTVSSGGRLLLHVGLNSGMLISSEVDKVTGSLSDTRTRFLGTLPAYLRTLRLSSKYQVCVALSSRSWVMIDRVKGLSDENDDDNSNNNTSDYNLSFVPLAYKRVSSCCSFVSETLSDGIVFASDEHGMNQINFVVLEEEDNKFHEERIPLLCTPRKFFYHKESGNYIIIESDVNVKFGDPPPTKISSSNKIDQTNIIENNNNRMNDEDNVVIQQQDDDDDDDDDMDVSAEKKEDFEEEDDDDDDMDVTHEEDVVEEEVVVETTTTTTTTEQRTMFPKILISPSLSSKVEDEEIEEIEGEGGDDDDDDKNNNTSQQREKTEEQKREEFEETKKMLSSLKSRIHKSKTDSSNWVSFLRILNPMTHETKFLLQFEHNEAALSMCYCYFKKIKKYLLVVGTVKDLRFFPRSCTAGFIRCYDIINSGTELRFLHSTLIEELPLALKGGFDGQLLVGMRNILRLYDYGEKRLLRKSEIRELPNLITKIETKGKRIYVSDVSQSIFYLKYKKKANSFVLFADNAIDRYLTNFEVLDFHTIAACDKFGNIFFTRLNKEEVQDFRFSETQDSWLYNNNERGPRLRQKAVEIVQFYVGEVVTRIRRACLIQGGRDVLIYSTVMGSIGILIPFRTKEEYEFFQQLEMELRQESPPLCGNDHLKYRSFYFPCRNVIDGDLCEFYLSKIKEEKRDQIAVDMDIMPNEIDKKIEYIKNQVGAF